MSEKILKIVDLFQFQEKSRMKAGDGRDSGRYKFFTSSPTQRKWIDEAVFDSEALVFGTGGAASVHYVNGRFATSADCLVAQLIDNKSNSAKYIWHYLNANIGILESGFKGAGLKHISKKYLENIKIPTPPYNEQKKTVAVLDRAFEIKELRELAISKLEDLMECRFFETFVDTEIDKSGWQSMTVELCAKQQYSSIRTGPFGSDLLHSEFVDEGIAVLGIDNVVTNTFSWSGRRCISEKKYRNLERYTVRPGDVLISIMGTCGRCAVVPDDIGVAINTKHLCCITLDENRCLPNFLHSYFLLHPAAKQYLLQTAKGAIMSGLNMNIIRKMPILVPPIALQRQYEQFVRKIHAESTKQKKMLVQCKNLIESLRHELFAVN